LPEKSIKYWLLPEINTLIQAGRIEGFFNTVPTAITPTSVSLRSTLAGGNGDPCSSQEISADFVLALIGYEQDDTLFKLADVERLGDCRAPRFNPETMETNVPGLFVIGTAVGGTQDKYSVFIENCHVHVARVLAALSGHVASRAEAEVPAEIVAQPES
jgi:thioredoxin reductase (NADPH)